MMLRRSLFALAATLAFSASTPAQNGRESGTPAPNLFPEIRPIAGNFEASERWIIHFEKRSFDLEAFRQAVWTGQSAERVEAILADYRQRVQADQAGFVAKLRAVGGQVVEQWWIINACSVDVPKGIIQGLRKLPGIAYIEPDQVWEPLIKTATNAKNHNADLLQARNFKGAGVTTAIMDTGLDEDMGKSGRPHRCFFVNGDLNNKTGSGIKGTRLLLNRKIGRMPADDVNGHGTGVASIVAGANWGTKTADHGHAYSANIAGYSIADSRRGSATTTTMTKAWQAIAADKVKYKIVSANNSYTGSPNPLNATQKALCNTARNADILIAVAAGNKSGNTRGSQIAVNGISVGAVYENTHRRAGFTSYGRADGQIYPDICANGVSTNMARRDNENRDYVGSGTSMASPQVCGAATQLRAIMPKLRADEIKAILLATTKKNSGAGATQSNTGPGCGYLQNDKALTTLLSKHRHGRAKFDSTKKKLVRGIYVTKGVQYQIALTWHRYQSNSRLWSNLDLRVFDRNTLVVQSKTTRNAEEFVRFIPTKSGLFNIEFVATSLANPAQEFAWASNADTTSDYYKPGSTQTFGEGCPGSVQVPITTGLTLPAIAATKFGNSADILGSGIPNFRYQQLFLANELPSSLSILGYSLRHDDAKADISGGTQSYRIFLGYSKRSLSNLSKSFAQNYDAGIASTEVFRGKVNIPKIIGKNQDPKLFAFKVKFPKPFVYTKRPGENLLFELQNSSSSSITGYFDAVYGSSSKTSRVYGPGAIASQGFTEANAGMVIRFDSLPGIKRLSPKLSYNGLPEVKKSFKVLLSQAPAQSPGALLLGLSKRQWLSVPLPISLAGGGAKGCQLLVSWDLMLPVATDAKGAATFQLRIPKDKQLIGKRFYNQFFVLDSKANKMGISWTNGGAAIIGG
ncbi:MAG: hypothetical protein CSA62_08615 [Planctomycetota bacterium]|nr:MAG: hypothetical protein CSA62_08615 [Planctomycetota bacterium]